MISTIELKRAAAEEGIPFHSIEKDYVIGWTLWGIANTPALSKVFIFKGGTALRKCYFKNYRFSEDLDFTVKGAPLDKAELKAQLEGCADAITRASGMKMSLAALSQTRDEVGEEALEGKLAYVGPSKQVTTKPMIKLDLTYYEEVLERPEKRPVIQSYSDAEEARIQVYTLEEIVAEKLRSMLQQIKRVPRPRDWYDVWFLLTKEELDRSKIKDLFDRKCAFKDVPFQSSKDFFDASLLEKVAVGWERSLDHQIKDVPSFKAVLGELRHLLKWLDE